MHIEEIHIENFKLFGQKSFKFHPEFNLVVGVNGSGKTSLLKAIVLVLTDPLLSVAQNPDKQSLPNFNEEDICQIPISTVERFRFEKKYPVKIKASIKYAWQDLIDDVKFEHLAPPTNHFNLSHSKGRIKKQAEIIKGKWQTLPVMAFYPCKRLWRNSGQTPTPFDAATERESRLAGYDYWFDASADFPSFWRWVIAKHLERLEVAEARGSIADYEAAVDISHGGMVGIDELQLVNKAVAGCLENAKGIRYDLKQKTILVGWNTGDFTPFELLSDGQRVTLAMVADIARRACLLNPHLAGEVLEETPGIVLIDELDLHLHPKWQRRIIGDLRRTFPKIQFIATTHSPFLIQSVRKGELINFDAKTNKTTPEYADQSIEDIAENIQDVPMPQKSERYLKMVEVAEQYYRLLRTACPSDEDELALLKTKLDELTEPFSDDPAYQALLRLERAVVLGEEKADAAS